MPKKINTPSTETLERMYLIENKSTHEIAKEWGVSQETARKWLMERGVTLRSHSQSLMVSTKRPSNEWLEEAYSVQGKTARMISEELGVPTTTVYSWMKAYKIPRRESYDSIVMHGGSFGGWNKVSVPPREDLYDMYVSKRISAPQIGKTYNVAEFTVRRWLTGYGIEIRSQSEAHKVNGEHLNKEWLYDQYVTQKKSTITISQELGISKKTVIRTLRIFGIPRRTTSEALIGNSKRSGENNPMWKGGLSSHTKKLRYMSQYLQACRAVKRRDKTCLLCLYNGENSKGKNHEVHHIDPISAALLLVFDAGNMVLLCKECHLGLLGKEKRAKRLLFKLVKESEQRSNLRAAKDDSIPISATA